ncbi:MAG: tRNA lysidine(34) synthetase TilS, partial [Xanthomonadales bacterium]|nr:tRNA lysidine(34) synthetase TilS [Xanthomonadales bacterium]
NLMRASGIDGLAGIPRQRKLGRGMVLRPLLDFPMASLRQFLVSRNTSWLEDPSNEDLAFDRNYIRHQILPLIEARWPNAASRIARSADFCRQASSLLDSTCEAMMQNQGAKGPVIRVAALEPGAGYFSLLLRSWLKVQQVPPMPAGRIIELERQLIESAQDKRPAIEWGGHVLRFFDSKLWLQKIGDLTMCPTLKWVKPGPLRIDHLIGTLEFKGRAGQPSGEILVSARRDGDRIDCQQGRRTVKDILREAGVPPWLRGSVPMLRRDEQLLAIAGVCVNRQLGSWMRENDVQLLWKPESPVLQEVLENVPLQAVDHDQGLR